MTSTVVYGMLLVEERKDHMGDRPKIDWGGADWARQDVDLAGSLGVSREAVRQARRRLGKGHPEGYRQRTGVTAGQRIKAMVTDGRTIVEIAKAAGCGEAYARVALRAGGKGYKRRPKGNARYDWSLLPADWKDRTDKEMAELVGASSPAVVTQWRVRHGMRKRGVS